MDLEQGMKWVILVIRSTSTRIESLPFETGRSVIKLQDKPFQGESGTGSDQFAVTQMSQCLSLLARMAGIDIVLGERVDAGEPVISSDQFDGSSNAGVADKWHGMAFSQDIYTQ